MNAFRPILLLGLAWLMVTAPLNVTAQLTGNAAGKNFSLPLFTDAGARSALLRASLARTVGGDRIELVEMNLTLFSSDVANQIDTIILAPVATFLPSTTLASGEKSVRVIRDDIEITGEQWTYDPAGKKVSLQKNTRVVFQAQLPDILR